MADKELFAELAEQRARQALRGLQRLLTAERRQVMLRAVDLDGLVAADDSVRDVWSFVEGLDLSALYTAIEAREGEPGHPAIDPKILMALWLYATIRGIGSARAVERLCEREIGFEWLCGGVGVNYHTLSDFRVAHGDLLDRPLSESVAALCAEGLVSLERLSLDGYGCGRALGLARFAAGHPWRGAARKHSGWCAVSSRSCKKIRPAGERRQQAARRRATVDRLQRVNAALPVISSRENERRHRERGHAKEVKRREAPRVSTTDPEARVTKMPDGGWRAAYNSQLISDPLANVVVAVDVDTSGSDHGWIRPMLRQTKQRYGRTPSELLVDGAFSRAEDVEWAARPRTEP